MAIGAGHGGASHGGSAHAGHGGEIGATIATYAEAGNEAAQSGFFSGLFETFANRYNGPNDDKTVADLLLKTHTAAVVAFMFALATDVFRFFFQLYHLIRSPNKNLYNIGQTVFLGLKAVAIGVALVGVLWFAPYFVFATPILFLVAISSELIFKQIMTGVRAWFALRKLRKSGVGDDHPMVQAYKNTIKLSFRLMAVGSVILFSVTVLFLLPALLTPAVMTTTLLPLTLVSATIGAAAGLGDLLYRGLRSENSRTRKATAAVTTLFAVVGAASLAGVVAGLGITSFGWAIALTLGTSVVLAAGFGAVLLFSHKMQESARKDGSMTTRTLVGSVAGLLMSAGLIAAGVLIFTGVLPFFGLPPMLIATGISAGGLLAFVAAKTMFKTLKTHFSTKAQDGANETVAALPTDSLDGPNLEAALQEYKSDQRVTYHPLQGYQPSQHTKDDGMEFLDKMLDAYADRPKFTALTSNTRAARQEAKADLMRELKTVLAYDQWLQGRTRSNKSFETFRTREKGVPLVASESLLKTDEQYAELTTAKDVLDTFSNSPQFKDLVSKGAFQSFFKEKGLMQELTEKVEAFLDTPDEDFQAAKTTHTASKP